jgi:hypothetical protein
MAASEYTRKQAAYCHPDYLDFQAEWIKLAHVREGTGGFLDGKYLIAHPREWKDYDSVSPSQPTKKLVARRTLASYENFAATIIDAFRSALTREAPIRRLGESKDAPIQEFWENCDGAGTAMSAFMSTAFDIAGTFGHMFLYMDRAKPADAPETAADESLPFLRYYTPLDAWDWLIDDLGVLRGVKFAECAPRTDFQTPVNRGDFRVRVVTDTSWSLYDMKGKLIEEGDHGMGRVPVAVLFTQRRPLRPHIGASLLGDPDNYIDLYNLVSEVRELLRNQTFSILNIPLGTGPDAMTVEQAQTLMGNAKGTDNALFSGLAASFIQADASNIEAYHAELQRKLRGIYRLASLSWESDSKDAEAEGSLNLKREDMNQRLSGYANELERCENEIAELFYRATVGDTGWDARMESDQVQVKYPDTFDLTPFDDLLKHAQQMQAIGMPPLFLKELRKTLTRKYAGSKDWTPELLEQIDEQIDAAPDDLTPAEQAQQRLDLTMQAMKQGATKEPKPPQPPIKDAKAKAA